MRWKLCWLVAVSFLLYLAGCPDPCKKLDSDSGGNSRRDTATMLSTNGQPIDDRIDPCAGDNTDWRYILIEEAGWRKGKEHR